MPAATPPTGIRYGSLCSGIEAATAAWHGLGWAPAWFSQFDPEHSYKSGPDFPSAVLAHHYPTVPNLGDMTAADWMDKAANLGDIDVLVGGTPCQAFSVAGLRQGLNDSRGQLSLRFCEIANAANPQVVIWENVPGVLSDSTNGFGCLLAGLAGEDGALQPPGGKWTDAGVVFGPERTIAWRILDAQYFGVAQRRRRVFVVACPAAGGLNPAEILFEFDGVRRDSAPSREAGQGAAAGADGGADGASGSGWRAESDGVAAVATFDWQKGNDVGNPRPSTMNMEEECSLTIGTSRVPAVTHFGDDLSHLDGVAVSENQRAEVCETGVVRSVTKGGGKPGQGFPATRQAGCVRRLTPTECERLQGFPDGYTLIPWKSKAATACPDGPRYKALGNSMAVPCMAWIGRRIAAALARRNDRV